MKKLENIDVLLVTTPTNIRYLTGFVGVAPEEREAYVLLAGDKTYFFTSSLYMEQAKKLSPIQISSEYPITNAIENVMNRDHRLRGDDKLEFEENDMTVAEFNKFSKLFAMIPTQGKIETLRQIKRPDEIAHLKLAASITDQCFKFLLRRIRPGVTESRLAAEIEGFCKYKGAQNAFSPIVAFNEHASQPHYDSTGNSPLRRGSLVLIDMGARVNGYCADMTRVIFLGKPKEAWAHAYETIVQAQNTAIDLLKNGVRNGATLDAAAKEVIAEADLPPYAHSLGHNVGLDIHEGPRLSDKKAETLVPGMVFSIEPGVYIPGQYGIRIEDLVRLTDTGIEILSKSPKGITIL